MVSRADKMTVVTKAASYIARTSVSADPICMVYNVIHTIFI